MAREIRQELQQTRKERYGLVVGKRDTVSSSTADFNGVLQKRIAKS
jgi:hypothetical protein